VQYRRGRFAIVHANIKEEDGVSHRGEMKFARVELTGTLTNFAIMPCLTHNRGFLRLRRYSTLYWGYRTQCISSQVYIHVTPVEGSYSGRSGMANSPGGRNTTFRKGEVYWSSSCHVSITCVTEAYLCILQQIWQGSWRKKRLSVDVSRNCSLQGPLSHLHVQLLLKSRSSFP
jgi:hypothetical protein